MTDSDQKLKLVSFLQRLGLLKDLNVVIHQFISPIHILGNYDPIELSVADDVQITVKRKNHS